MSKWAFFVKSQYFILKHLFFLSKCAISPVKHMYLDEMNNTEFDSDSYKEMFLQMVAFIKNHFPIGFRKEENSGSTPRVRFEAIAVGTYLALKINADLVPTYLKWLDSTEFAKHTTSDSSNNKGKLAGRIEFVRDCLLNKITEDSLTYA